MICIICSRDFDGVKGENICGICLRAVKPDILENSIAALEHLQMNLAVSKNSIKISAHDFGRLNPQAEMLTKHAYQAVGTILADIGALLDKLRRLQNS